MSANHAKLDEAILSQTSTNWLKVARVIAKSAEALGNESDETYGALEERIVELVAAGKLEAQGDLSNWRHSEVRLAQ
jgi:Protein of unknown function